MEKTRNHNSPRVRNRSGDGRRLRSCAPSRQRGVLHILFLVFAVIGVSLWGISEFLLSAEKESRGITAESASVITETKQILIDYAISPPPAALEDVADCGLQTTTGCYNYYNSNQSAYAKYTPFTLPCPDLTLDGNLDGASDPGTSGCSAQNAGALESSTETLRGQEVTLNHRFGRMPWRDQRAAGIYARGLGNRDLRDGAAARLWYGVSRNLAPCVVRDPRDDQCQYHGQLSAARNAAALLTMTTGWLSVVTQDDEGNQIVLSDRVAAVVISPGAADGHQSRADEDAIYAGVGAASVALPTIALAQNYVEGENADGDDVFFAYGQYGISLQVGDRADSNASPTRHAEDHLEYITIDELVAAFISSEQESPYQDDIADLLEGYYNRLGHYPDPAVFHQSAGEGKSRPVGTPSTTPQNIPGGQVLIRRAAGADDVLTIALRVSDLPPVYLAPGWRFPEQSGNFDDEPGFPFNESLAKMNTRFSDSPLEGLAGADNYDALYAGADHVVNTDAIYGLSALEMGAAATLAPSFAFVARAPEIQAEPGANLRVILAAPLAINSTASVIADFTDDESTPPGGADIVLPAGTELELSAGSDTYVQFPAGLQVRGKRYRSTLAAELLGVAALRRRYPELNIPLRVQNPTISQADIMNPAGDLTFDQNGELGGVGPRDGWMRAVSPGGNISRYEFRPVFRLNGPLAALTFDDTGYLSRTDRAANLNAGHTNHFFTLASVQIRDPGGYPGVGIHPRNLRATMQVIGPRAWELNGSNNDDVTSRDLDRTDNDHLGSYFLIGPAFPQARRRVEDGGGNFSGTPIVINFDQAPFSQVLIYPNPGGSPTRVAPQCAPQYCPYSTGFFADEIIIGLVPNATAINAEAEGGEATGVELTEQTLLPARLVDRGGGAVVSLIRAAPSESEAVAGRMGFVPAMRLSAGMDPRFFSRHTVSILNSFSGNAAARLYFPLTMASRFARQLIPFPPPGRPAIGGAPAAVGPEIGVENSLRPLPQAFTVPSGAAVGMPPGTQIVIPTITTAMALGRDFTFPGNAVAILPPGSEVLASVVAGQVLPNGMQIAALGAGGEARMVSLPHGGILPLEGSRFLAGGGLYDEMLELEIRGGATGTDDNLQRIDLADGAIVQPFTRRAVSPNRIALEDGAQLEGGARIRARFFTRPQTAPRSGEPQEPTYPLMFGPDQVAEQDFASGTFNYEDDQSPAGAVNLTFDEDTEFVLPPDAVLNVAAGTWPNILSDLSPEARTFFTRRTFSGITPDPADRAIYTALRTAMRAWVAQDANYYDALASLENSANFARNVRHLSDPIPVGPGLDPCNHINAAAAGGPRALVDCLFAQVPQNPVLPSNLAYGAVELDPATGEYFLVDEATRSEVALTATLPRGTRIYDKSFANGRALVAASDLFLPLGGDLGGANALQFNDGFAQFHFALLPENDMILRAPGGQNIVVPAGAVVDMGGRVVHPPAGVMRIPRVAGDLEVVSDETMMIYIGGEDSAVEYEYAEVIRRGEPEHAAMVTIAVPYQTAGALPDYRQVGGLLAETAPGPGNERMSIPEGAVIVVPPGDPLPLHASYLLTSTLAQSHLRLSPDSVMVLREGLTARMDGGGEIAGPAYVRLGGMADNGRVVAANLVLERANIPSSGRSFVMLHSPARMRPRPGARRDSPKAAIPAQARLDLFGNMEARADSWFFDEMIPSHAAEILKNHPMALAVAPECRRNSAEAEECEGENFQGLTFDIPAGEEIALPEDTPAPEQFRIEAGDGGSFNAALYNLDAPDAPVQTASVAYLRSNADGELFSDGFSTSELSETGATRGRKYVVVEPPNSGLRVYLGVGAPSADPAALAAERLAANYVEVRQALTVHSGGYVGDGYSTNAENLARAEIEPGDDFVLGAGSRPFDGGLRPGAFAPGSEAVVQLGGGISAEVDLADYVAVNDGQLADDFFNYEVTVGAQIARVDSLGRVENYYRAGEHLFAETGGVEEFDRLRAYEVAAEPAAPLRLAMGQTLAMEPGYLWQGFIPAGGVDLEFTRNDDLWRAYWPPSPESPEEALMQSRIYLRVHPADLALNFFGAGVETVEGLDGEAATVTAREALAMSEALFQDFSRSDLAPAGAGMRRMTGYRMSVRSAGVGTELLGPYYQADQRPYYVHLNTPDGPGDPPHGVNPDILHIPPALRHDLISRHALRINSDGTYAAEGSAGNAEAFSYNALSPVFHTSGRGLGGSIAPGAVSPTLAPNFTNLPPNGLKVRRVRLGMDPYAARLIDPAAGTEFAEPRIISVPNPPNSLHEVIANKLAAHNASVIAGSREDGQARYDAFANISGILCDPAASIGATVAVRFAQPAVPPPPYNPEADIAEFHADYPATNLNNDDAPLPCAPYGRADHTGGFDALFAMKMTTDAAGNALADPFFLNPPILAVVRDLRAGRAITVTTHWHNFYAVQADNSPSLSARMIWGAARNALELGGNAARRETRRNASAPRNFQHIRPVSSRDVDSPEFMHDQDWDWFAFAGKNVASLSFGAATSLPPAAQAFVQSATRQAGLVPSFSSEYQALIDAVVAWVNEDPNYYDDFILPYEASILVPFSGIISGGVAALTDGACPTDIRGYTDCILAQIPQSPIVPSHTGVLSGPFSHLSPTHPDNISASGLDMSALNGMCGVDGPGDYLTAQFAPPPIQLAALDVTPGLAWPRPGREFGTYDYDKRIRGAFIPGADKAGLLHYLSPFQHETAAAGVPEFSAAPHETLRVQNRVARGAASGEWEAIPAGGWRKVPPVHIPMNRARLSRTGGAHSPQTFADLDAGDSLRTRVYSELYVYMDRPYNPEYLGGETQKLVIGSGFQVEGAAAIVPPFAAAADRAAADIMAQRSKMMSDLFGISPLGESYAADVAGSARCRGMNPCPAMWTRSDWAAVLGGVVAMDAVNMKIESVRADSDVLRNIYFIQPQPELDVQVEEVLPNGTTVTVTRTLYAGSVIYPFRGEAIPAAAVAADAEAGISDRAAVSAVDVSPAVVPSPVRIFREKTHLAEEKLRDPQPVPRRAIMHGEIVVENRIHSDGGALVEAEQCNAFIPVVPAPGAVGALPNVAAGAAAYDSGEVSGHVVTILADGTDVPNTRYPIDLTFSAARMQKAAGTGNNHQGAILEVRFGDMFVSIQGVVVDDTAGTGLLRLRDNANPNADDGITIVLPGSGPMDALSAQAVEFQASLVARANTFGASTQQRGDLMAAAQAINDRFNGVADWYAPMEGRGFIRRAAPRPVPYDFCCGDDTSWTNFANAARDVGFPFADITDTNSLYNIILQFVPTPRGNRIAIDFSKTSASLGIRPFDIETSGPPDLSPVALPSSAPQGLVYLQASLNPNLCGGLVPPGFLTPRAVLRNNFGNLELDSSAIPITAFGRVPSVASGAAALSATITISRPLLMEVPFIYNHESGGILGFNDESLAAAAARGPIPSGLTESDALFSTLESACPDCLFRGADVVSGLPLRIEVPVGSTLRLTERRESRLIQSYDFGVSEPVSILLTDAGAARTPLSDYEANNAVNDYFKSADCRPRRTNPDGACRFLEGSIAQVAAGAGQAGYYLEYEAPSGLVNFQVDALAVAPTNELLGAVYADAARNSVIVVDPSPSTVSLAASAAAGAVAAFLLETEIYQRGAVVTDVPFYNAVLAARASQAADVVARGFLDDIAAAVRLRFDGDPNYYTDRVSVVVENGGNFLTSNYSNAFTDLAGRTPLIPNMPQRSDFEDFKSVLDALPTSDMVAGLTLYAPHLPDGLDSDGAWIDAAGTISAHSIDGVSLVSPAPASNTQSHGFAVRLRVSYEEYSSSHSGAMSPNIVDVPVAFEPYDIDSPFPPSDPRDGRAAYPSRLIGTQLEILNSRDAVMVTQVFYEQVRMVETTVFAATINVESYPLNVGVAFVSGDNHAYATRESYNDVEAALLTLAGVSEYDLLTRREFPLVSLTLDSGTIAAGRPKEERWHSSILGSEFHFAPLRAGVNGTLFSDYPPATQAFRDELERRRQTFATTPEEVALYTRMLEILELRIDGNDVAGELTALISGLGGAMRTSARNAAIAAASDAGTPDPGGALLARVIGIYEGVPVGGVCVVEPLGFLPLYDVEYDSPDNDRFGGNKVRSRVSPIARLRWDAADSEARGYYPGRFEVLGGNVNEVRRYDGGFVRGFLASPHVANALAAYYSGDEAWRGEDLLANGRQFVDDGENAYLDPLPFRVTMADGSLSDFSDIGDYPINRGQDLPDANEHIRLRSPLSYLWQSRGNAIHAEWLGARRINAVLSHRWANQTVCNGMLPRDNADPAFCANNANASPFDFLNPGADNFSRTFGAYVPAANLMALGNDTLFNYNRVRSPFLPFGVRLRSGADIDSQRPIQALRLPHAIESPPQSRIRLAGGGLGYPSSPEGFYRFPADSRAMVMNMDMSSWESIHPGMVATRGGMTYRHMNANSAATGQINDAPAGAPGEAFNEFDVGGRSFLHYHRSESAPAEEPTSARQIHANVWVRLKSPTFLRRNGERTLLREGAVLNPVAGTYVNLPRENVRAGRDVKLPYSSDAVGATGANGGGALQLVRAALMLPKGAKLVVRQSGTAKMTKVRAAVFFSPAPLKRTECPASADGVNQFERTGTLDDGTLFTLGHPCAWLENRENMDGDRDFVYTNRPRWNDTRTRILTNDRVALIGGELEF